MTSPSRKSHINNVSPPFIESLQITQEHFGNLYDNTVYDYFIYDSNKLEHGFAINTLTVMANESYDVFAKKLQSEYETDEGIRFGVLESQSFANIPVKQAKGSVAYLGMEKSELIYHAFRDCGYIDGNGQNKLYFVVETKGNILADALRPTESAKIRCGEKHFAALGQGAKFVKADAYERFIEQSME